MQFDLDTISGVVGRISASLKWHGVILVTEGKHLGTTLAGCSGSTKRKDSGSTKRKKSESTKRNDSGPTARKEEYERQYTPGQEREQG